jgi:hypothetical protein
LLLEHDPGLYAFINQGMLTIDRVDDCQEMKDTKTAFDILLFTEVIFSKFKKLNHLFQLI